MGLTASSFVIRSIIINFEDPRLLVNRKASVLFLGAYKMLQPFFLGKISILLNLSLTERGRQQLRPRRQRYQ